MPVKKVWTFTTAVVLTVIAASTIAPAQAREGAALSGQYLVTSNGGWAKVNEVFRPRDIVRQVWTVTTSCPDSMNCAGRVSSSQGWSADIRYDGSWWLVKRALDQWEPCPDGSAAPGDQQYQFWGVNAEGQVDDGNVTLLAGNDVTFGQSGSCGKNKVLVISYPLRLQKMEQ